MAVSPSLFTCANTHGIENGRLSHLMVLLTISFMPSCMDSVGCIAASGASGRPKFRVCEESRRGFAQGHSQRHDNTRKLLASIEYSPMGMEFTDKHRVIAFSIGIQRLFQFSDKRRKDSIPVSDSFTSVA